MKNKWGNKPKIMFYVGYSKKPWNPSNWTREGIGGSEYCVIKLSEKLAERGWEVWVVGEVRSCHVKGVTYLSTEQILNKGNERGTHAIAFSKFDWVVGVNYIHFLKALDDNDISFYSSAFWMHNEYFHDYYKGERLENADEILVDERIDHIICVSEWQREYIKNQFKKALGNSNRDLSTYIQVLNNAIDPTDWEHCVFPKNKHSFVYTSATDRGLDKVLKMWPRIKQMLPYASLNIAAPPYSVDWGYDIDKIMQLKDVWWHGNLPPKKLYDLISRSEYWLYPSKYLETYCITALEMMMGGVKILSTNTGNLNDLLDRRGVIVDSGMDDQAIEDVFITAIARNNGSCHDDKKFHYYWFANTMRNKIWVQNENWDVRTDEWENVLRLDGFQ